MKVRIEELTEEVAKGLTDPQLFDLRLRSLQVWRKSFEDNSLPIAGGLRRDVFLQKYSTLRSEMEGRGLHPNWDTVDSYNLRRKVMQGLDPASIGDVRLREGYICAAGEFLDDPKAAGFCDLFLSGWLERQERDTLNTALVGQISKPVRFGQLADLGDDAMVMPLFDLVLRPRTDLGKRTASEFKELSKAVEGVYFCPSCYTSTMAIGLCPDCGTEVGTDVPAEKGVPDELVVSKPGFEETENEVRYRIRDPERFQSDSFRRIALQQTKPRVYGIVGRLTGETTTTLQALRFPKGDGWDIPKARSWVKAHPDVTKSNYGFLEERKFEHSSQVVEGEPTWGTVTKTRLPRTAFARQGDPDKVGTWGFPHHFVKNGGTLSKGGRFTSGEMYLHKGGLGNAWDRANQEASEIGAEEKAHLNDHRRILGIGEHAKQASVSDAEFSIVKVDEDQQVAGGVVYEPGVEDAQGDYTTSEEIWKAMVYFMENWQTIKVMHSGRPVEAHVIECYQVPEDFAVGTQRVRKGSWWLSVKIHDDEAWAAVKSGRLTGFSMGGYSQSE